MSLKENLDAIKEELSAEEKFLESVIKTETFYNKNKKLIHTLVIAFVLFVAGYLGYSYYQEELNKKSNEIFAALLKKDDEKLAKKLSKLNPKMYELYLFYKENKNLDANVLEKTSFKDNFLNKASKFQLALIKEDETRLKNITKDDIFSKPALLYTGYKYLEKKDLKNANQLFSLVEPNSIFYRIVLDLEHYVVVK